MKSLLILLLMFAPIAQASVPDPGQFDIEKIYVTVRYGNGSAKLSFKDYVDVTQPDVQSVLVRQLEE